MQVPYYPSAPAAHCIDAGFGSFAHMAYVVVQRMHKSWIGTMSGPTSSMSLRSPASRREIDMILAYSL